MRWLTLTLICCLFLPTASAQAGSPKSLSGAQTWQAGAAAVVITPPQAMWMSGYASRDRPAQGKIHDLFVKALALRDPAGRTVVLLTCDLVGIDRVTSQQICRRIQERHQLSRDQVAIATSHTHSGPVVGTNLLSMYSLEPSQQQLVQQYTGLLTDWCVSAADQAVAALQPVRLQVSEGTAKFAVNRRNNREPDVPMLRAEGKLAGPVDHRVPVLAARAADGKLVSVLFGYACHATVLSGMDWCGDWPGFAQLEIEKAHPGTIALFWAGCGADQNPLPRRTVELAMEYGRQAAVAVDQALSGEQTLVQGRLSTVYREIDLALDTLPTREQVEQDLKSENVYLARRARGLIRQFEERGSLAQTYPYPIQVWSLGDAATLTFLGGEVVVDYSLRIQQELSQARSWVAGYSNDVMAYIPSRRVLMEGGYEGESAMIYYGLPTKWSPDVEEHIIREIRSLHEAVAKKGEVQ